MKRLIFIFLLFVQCLFLSAADTITAKIILVQPDSVGFVYAGQTVSDTLVADSVAVDDQKIPEKPGDVLQAISFSNIFWTLVLLLIGYLFIKLIIKALELFAERSVKYRISIKSMIPVVRIVVWVIVIFAIVKGIYNPPLETLIAISASVTIAVGLAAQDLLKNVFGGLMLLFDRPFKVGDKIEAGKYYGEVLEIGLRSTRVVTPDDSVVTIPNMELMNNSVSNANSGELNCQVVAEVYLPIDVDTHKVRKIAIEAAQVSPFVYLQKPIVVLFFNEVKERRSYLKMRLKAYVMDIRYEFQFKSDMTETVVRELLAQGVLKKDDVV
ncbi:MAG TPA: mechanosensitive ion channel [Bacteroidales bacterium]|nr:mechanosensitive ion channel [Prolixibacteraceae bacterium]HPG73196.1 mechanosensitive ion channel [Bacteroidales bacterium]